MDDVATGELTVEERELAARVDAVARDHLVPIAHRVGEVNGIDRELLGALAEHGVLGVNIPTEYGGQGGEQRYSTRLCIMRETLGYHSPDIDFVFALQGLGSVAVVRHGTDAQRAELLPGLVTGDCTFAFALTEPHAGSDVRSMRTTLRRVDGADGLDGRRRLDGVKTYVSGAPDADVMVVVARDASTQSFSACLVRRDAPGVVTRRDIELSAPHSIGTIELDGVEVTDASMVGAEGQGLQVAFSTLEVYRPSVGALGVGMTRRALDDAIEWADGRTIRDAPLRSLDAISVKLGRMAVDAMVGRALVYRSAARRDGGQSSAREAAMAKLHATESAHRAVYESQQIHGARGVTRGRTVEALFRHVRQSTIYEGTSEIQRSIIARAEAERLAAGHFAAGPLANDDPSNDTADSLIGDLRSAIVESWRADPDPWSRQAIAFRLADACVLLDAADLLGADPQIDPLAVEVARLDATRATAELLDAVARVGSGSGHSTASAAAAAVRSRPGRLVDDPLLELAAGLTVRAG